MIIVRLCFIVIDVVVVARVLVLVSGDFGVDVCGGVDVFGGGGSIMFLKCSVTPVCLLQS